MAERWKPPKRPLHGPELPPPPPPRTQAEITNSATDAMERIGDAIRNQLAASMEEANEQLRKLNRQIVMGDTGAISQSISGSRPQWQSMDEVLERKWRECDRQPAKPSPFLIGKSDLEVALDPQPRLDVNRLNMSARVPDEEIERIMKELGL